MLFDNLGSRQVVADFSGGHVSSDGGLLLWHDLDRSLGVTRKRARCFRDDRDPDWIEHRVEELIAQRVLGLASGYEDINDHNRLRMDPLLAVAAGKADPLGLNRAQPDQRGKALAGAATLNRLELTNNKPDSRYHKIVADHPAIEELMAWCEKQPAPGRPVSYCLGLARKAVLVEKLQPALARARAQACLTGGQGRAFAEFDYQTQKSWSRPRRVIGKAEVISGQDNPRFVVTNLPAAGLTPADGERFEPRACYEQLYCARGTMENYIKEEQLGLFGERLSTHWLASNQLRLWFSALAQFLMERFRTIGLRGTALAGATAETIRTRLLKIGGLVTVSVRRVYVRL